MRQSRTLLVLVLAFLALGAAAWTPIGEHSSSSSAIKPAPTSRPLSVLQAPQCYVIGEHSVVEVRDPCHAASSHRTMVILSVLAGPLGLDHLYARNLQLFLPKVILTLFLTPYAWVQMVSRPSKTMEIQTSWVALFGLGLVSSSVWWFVDPFLWAFDFYTTAGGNGAWFGNPIGQCALKSWQ